MFFKKIITEEGKERKFNKFQTNYYKILYDGLFFRNSYRILGVAYRLTILGSSSSENLATLSEKYDESPTARKLSKYGVFSDPYFPALGLNTEFSANAGKNGPEKILSSGTFHAVPSLEKIEFCHW